MTLEELFRSQSDTTVYVGIDPGSEGAIGVVSGSRQAVVDVPTMKVKRGKGKKTTFDYQGVVKLFRPFNEFRELTFVALEVPPPAMKGSFPYAQFRLGIAYGMWPLFLAVKGLSLEEVQPGVWKKKMGLTPDKETSRHTAIKMFPALAGALARKKDHNRAEAVLLAEWLRRKHQGGN